MEKSNSIPEAFQVFILDNHKLKISRFTNKISIELLNLESQKVYSYESHPNGRQIFPLYITSIQEFYGLIYDALNDPNEERQVRIIPQTKIELLYQIVLKSEVKTDVFDFPIKEIYPQVPIDFEHREISLPVNNLANETNPQGAVDVDLVSQDILHSDLENSQGLSKSEYVRPEEFDLKFQNLLKNYLDQQNADILIRSFRHETNQKFKALELRIHQIEEAKDKEVQEQEIVNKVSGVLEERLNLLKIELEKKYECQIQQVISDCQLLSSGLDDNNSRLSNFESKIWGASFDLVQNQSDKEPLETRLEEILAESKRIWQNFEDMKYQERKSFFQESQDLSLKEIGKLQKKFEELKENQKIAAKENKSLWDVLTASLNKNDQFYEMSEHLSTLNIWVDEMKITSYETTSQLKAQISDLKREINALENSTTMFGFQSQGNQNQTLAILQEAIGRTRVPSEKDLDSHAKIDLKFDPKFLDPRLGLKDDSEISINISANNSTKRFYSHQSLPDSGKFMFSMKIINIKLGENGSIVIGIAPFKAEQNQKDLSGSFLIDTAKGNAYLDPYLKRFSSQVLQPGDILSLYVDLQNELIYFLINKKMVLNERIDISKWKQGEMYGGMITTCCEVLNITFVKYFIES